ncbi:putative quorum-sensing-regulated virulence factor [Acinetobacter thermotolerans]|uniref:putative quorum-sensing-regulated virulence factor n=1 Tax=Acinetobacter thermotolerans TaxID=3151487 RepID=UPI00325B3962
MQARILDTETNVLNGWPIQISHVACDFVNGELVIADKEQVYDRYFSCPDPISLGAMAVHHILPSDIEGRPDCRTFKLGSDVKILIGHNVDYDIRVLKQCDPSIKIQGICTLALARSVWPELDSHTLGALYYHVMPDKQEARRHLRSAHSARADIYFTGVILKHIVKALGIKDMKSLFLMSEGARLPKIMTFGKYKGTALNELPPEYVEWLLKQDNLDPYLEKALKGLNA